MRNASPAFGFLTGNSSWTCHWFLVSHTTSEMSKKGIRVIKSYQNHPSVLKSKNKFGSDSNSFDFQQIKAPEVKKLLKGIGIKKAVGVDTIRPKLVKIGADIIAEPLTQAINCCLRQGIFPENAKVASVVRLDKGKPDKYDLIYKPDI